MFETIAILVFLATIGGILVHWCAFPANAECRSGVIRGTVHVLCLFLIEQRASLLGALKKLCYLVSVVCFLVLGVTGFYPVLVHGEHLSGYLMMIHATFAPIFAICLAILALTWAGQYRFRQSDCPWLQGLLRRVTRLRIPAEAAEGSCPCSMTAQKMAFWVIVFLALPLILSVVLSMLPLYGTHWQEFALAVHRWTALVFAVVVLVHTYLAVRTRIVQ